ncbi:MAG: hypothetical protein AAGJ18_23480 [Bacteroidota bacterium]
MYNQVLFVHAILGIIFFLVGLLQFVLKRSGKRHRIFGRIYFFSWIGLLLTGAYIADLLITIFGIFGFYYVLTGTRAAMLKGKSIQLFDKIIVLAGGIFSLTLIVYGVKILMSNNQNFGIISLVFGLLFGLSASQDISKHIIGKPLQKKNFGKMDWFFDHSARMIISYIAAVSAFTSIQNIFGNTTANFLVPVALGIIYMRYTERKYKKEFGLI